MREYTQLETQLIQALMDVYDVIDIPSKDMCVPVAENSRNKALEIMHPLLVEHQGAVKFQTKSFRSDT